MPSAKNQQIWWLKLNGKTTAPKFGSRTFLYWPYYYYKNNFDPEKFILDVCEQTTYQIVHGLCKT